MNYHTAKPTHTKPYSSRPGLLEKISFGLGDFSNNGMFTFVSTYLMFYFTDTLGMSLGAVTVILVAGRVADALFSIIMGQIVDRTETSMGKCRPFQALGILPSVLLMILMFSLPASISDSKKVLLAAGGYILFSIAYAFMNVPYSAALTVLTSDNNERISLNRFKLAGANLGGIFVTAATLRLVKFFEKNGISGFSGTSVFYGAVFFLGVFMCVAFTHERVHPPRSTIRSLREFVDSARVNQPWLVLCCVQFLAMTGFITRNQSTLYYAKYCLENESLSSFMLTLNPVIGVVISLLLPSAAKKTGLKACVVTGNLLWVFSMAGTWFFGQSTGGAILFHVVACVGWNVATCMIFVMISQTIDYAQWKTGKRPQGLFTSLVVFVQKLGIAGAGFLCSKILAIGGYAANQPASPATVLAIRVLFSLLPLVISLCILFTISFYHLDKIYPDIEQELVQKSS